MCTCSHALLTLNNFINKGRCENQTVKPKILVLNIIRNVALVLHKATSKTFCLVGFNLVKKFITMT